MFLIRLFRFLTGYILFRGSGGFPERFLNLCSQNGVSIWDAKSADGTLTAKTNLAGYKKIRLPAKRSGMRIRMVRKCGLPFLLQPYRKRKGILVGIVLSAVVLTLLNAAVWTISVEGNENFTEEQILDLAESHGIHPGAFKKNIDIRAIREDIKASVDGINWFSINMNGCHVSLRVSETQGKNEIIDRQTPCNIVSDVDGEVLKLDAYEGTAALRPGSAVTKGDLLIGGVIEKSDGSAGFVHARGSAIIRTNRTATSEIPYELPCAVIQEQAVRRSVMLFGIEIPLGVAPAGNTVRSQRACLQYKNTVLPLGIRSEISSYLSEKNLTLSGDEASLLCGFSLFMQEKTMMQNAETESKTVTLLQDATGVRGEIRYINHQKTGVEQFFAVEEG